MANILMKRCLSTLESQHKCKLNHSDTPIKMAKMKESGDICNGVEQVGTLPHTLPVQYNHVGKKVHYYVTNVDDTCYL